jgi:hypothetical protein
MKTEKFNISTGLKNPKTLELTEINGMLISEYGIKCIIHEQLESIHGKINVKQYNLTEYNTGMAVRQGFKNKKAAIEFFNQYFNDQNLTEFGRAERINYFNNTVQENLKLYGRANI